MSVHTVGNLLGPQGAMDRLRELQQRIDTFLPPEPTAVSKPATFASTLSGAINGNAPVDPSSMAISGSNQYAPLADAAAQKYGLDGNIFRNLISTESAWNPNTVSNKGAVGLTQLMPDTAAGLGINNPYDPGQNLDGGAHYLRQMLDQFGGNYSKALAAYNAGPAAVQKANGIPPYQETIAYVRKILGGSR